MLPFDTLFMDLAGKEVRVIHSRNSPDLPPGTFLFRELYCSQTGCDCRRVMLHVFWVEQGRTVASVNYAFERPKPPFDDEPQIFLDPLNPQSNLSEVFCAMFQQMIAADRPYHERLVRHYELWKSVVDDSNHPQHAALRKATTHG
jgi:hypothetical protein